MDSELEKAIDRVGRDKVFALAKANGWGPSSSPPKHVWWGIVRQLERDKPDT